MTYAGQTYSFTHKMSNQAQQPKGTDPTGGRVSLKDSKKQGAGDELDSLCMMIDGKEKNINAFTKTKLDWEKHTKEQKMEDELEKNRKDGYL